MVSQTDHHFVQSKDPSAPDATVLPGKQTTQTQTPIASEAGQAKKNHIALLDSFLSSHI